MTKPSLFILLAIAGCTDHYSDDGGDTKPPPVANDDHIMIGEDQSLDLKMLTANDENVQYTTVVDMPQHGTISSGVYRPEPAYFGPDTFTYTGKGDYYGGASAPATVYLLVTSDGIAYEHSQSLTDRSANDLAVGDIDGDGKVDLVSCNTNLNEIDVYRNVTAAPGQYAVDEYRFEGGTYPAHVAVADLDRDGRADVITAADDGLTILRNITMTGGPLAFAAPARLGNVSMDDVVAADIDGDGITDLAAIGAPNYYSSGTLHVWLNQSTSGTLAFGAEATFATAVSPTRLAEVDADDDGRVDLAVLGGASLSMFVNATSAGATIAAFQARIDRATAPNPLSMFLLDLDGDGRKEIGVFHQYGDLWIYANNATTSTPSFEAARALDVPSYIALVQPADVDGNGVMDLIGAATGDAPFTYLTNHSQLQSYSFDAVDAEISDVATRRLAGFATPTAMQFVELDGVAPAEMVVASRAGNPGTAGLRVLFGP
jgi:hypothetical protein